MDWQAVTQNDRNETRRNHRANSCKMRSIFTGRTAPVPNMARHPNRLPDRNPTRRTALQRLREPKGEIPPFRASERHTAASGGALGVSVAVRCVCVLSASAQTVFREDERKMTVDKRTPAGSRLRVFPSKADGSEKPAVFESEKPNDIPPPLL